MKLYKWNIICLLIMVLIGLVCIGEPMLVGEYQWSAKANEEWIPADLEALYEQRQGMNFKAEVNRSFVYYADGVMHYDWQTIIIALYPWDTDIKIILDVRFVKVGDMLLPVYSFNYVGEFIYDNPANTTVYFPLPYGTITDLVVKVNQEEERKPEIVLNQVKINLTQENSTLWVSFNSCGKYSYSHQVPRNIFVENFTLEIEIINVNDEMISSERGESPTGQTFQRKSVTLTWDNRNTIMREDIVIDIQSKEVKQGKEPWPFFMRFLYGLLFLGPIIAVFYIEGLGRIERDRKGENAMFLFLPYLLFCVLLGVLIYLIETLPSLFVSVLGFSTSSYILKKRAIKITKGLLGFFLVPVLLVLSMIGLIMEEIRIGAMLTLVSVPSMLGVFTMYLAKNPRKTRAGQSKNSKKQAGISNTSLENTKGSAIPPPPKAQEDQKNRRYCPHCGFKVNSEFGFCPKCGRDISLLKLCLACGTLQKKSEDALFCPNCGNLDTAEAPPKEPKKRFFAKMDKENPF